MESVRRRKLLGMLLAGTWLPISVSCDPIALDGYVRIERDDRYHAGVVIEDCCDDWWDDDWSFDGWWDGFHFNVWYDD